MDSPNNISNVFYEMVGEEKQIIRNQISQISIYSRRNIHISIIYTIVCTIDFIYSLTSSQKKNINFQTHVTQKERNSDKYKCIFKTVQCLRLQIFGVHDMYIHILYIICVYINACSSRLYLLTETKYQCFLKEMSKVTQRKCFENRFT